MPLSHPYQQVPVGSLSLLPEQERLECISLLKTATDPISSVLLSSDTGSYVKGLAKGYRISEDDSVKIAQMIFLTAIGKKQINQLSTILASELKIPEDAALKIASEIDQDLFAPIQADLDEFWAQQSNPISPPTPTPSQKIDFLPKKTEQTKTVQIRTPNILNLKELTGRPDEKELPARPVLQKLTAGSRIVDLKNVNQPTAPHPHPEQERGASPTAPQRPTPPAPPLSPKPTFPLPPSIRK